MIYLPHSVGIRRPSKARGVAYSDPENLDCQFTPARMGTVAWNQSGVQIDSPHLLMWNVEKPLACPVGSVFEFMGEWFAVSTPTQLFTAHPMACSCSAYCERLQYAPEALDILEPSKTASGSSGRTIGVSNGSGGIGA